MNSENGIDKLNIIKQVGKGSFSNVYLCQCSQLGSLQLDDIPTKYIVKEININSLVRKYLGEAIANKPNRYNKQKGARYGHNDNTLDVNITPYEKGGWQVEDVNASEEYYFARLKELVESEVEAMLLLDHENIIKLYGSKFENGEFFLTMEYCELGDVYQTLRSNGKGMSYSFVFDFMIQIIRGLQYIHQKHIVHRDIKLHNILMKQCGDKTIFQISDFGFACYDLSDESMKDHLEAKDILATKYFKLCGTPFYMAPEIILNMSLLDSIADNSHSIGNVYDRVFYSTAIDIWSYGICVFELVYDRVPFPTIRTMMELEEFFKSEGAQKYINNRIDENTCLHPKLRKLLHLMLQMNPNNRTTSDHIIEWLDVLTSNELEATVNNNIVVAETNYYGQVNVSDMFESVNISDSWQHISKLDSLVKKTSVERGLLAWLLNRK